MTKEFDPRIIKARASLIQNQPFFGALALYLQLQEDPSVETMATDGDHLAYAPAFLDRTTPLELQGVIAHEVLHCAYQHHTRRGSRDPDLWNDAADYAINRDLLAAGFTLPGNVLVDQQYAGMSAEEIYVRLAAKKQQKPQQSPGQQPKPGQQSQPGANPSQGTPGGQGSKPDAGQGLGGAPAQGTDMGRCGRVVDAAPAHAPAELGKAEAEWEGRVRQALAVAAAHNAGETPSALQALAVAIKKPKVDWRDQLRRFVDERTRVDYSWSKPNKRYLNSGFILPGIIPDGLNKLGVIIDTSGSISERLLGQFLGELQAAVDEGAADHVVIVQCDARVQQVQHFDRGDEIQVNIVGRGGTRFSPALEWFNQNEPDVAALIYFTDLDSRDFGNEPGCPLLWAAYGMESQLDKLIGAVPFGEVIKVPME